MSTTYFFLFLRHKIRVTTVTIIITETATTELKMAATISPVRSEGEVASEQLVTLSWCGGRKKEEETLIGGREWSEEGEREGGKQVRKRGRERGKEKGVVFHVHYSQCH